MIGQASLYNKYIHESSKNKTFPVGLLWNIIITIIFTYHLSYSGAMNILNVVWCALLQTLTASWPCAPLRQETMAKRKAGILTADKTTPSLEKKLKEIVHRIE